MSIKQAQNSRQFQPKQLQTEIQTRYEEQRRQRSISSNPVSKYQFEYTFDDVDMIYDICHLILTYVHASNHGNTIDQTRVESFFNTFIPTFFDLDSDNFQRKMSDIYIGTPSNEEAEDEAVTEEIPPARGRRGANGRKGTLLRGVLDRKQKDRDGSAMRDSKETTPDIGSMDDDNVATPSEDTSRADATDHRWTELPQGPIRGDEPFKRDSFNLYASLHIYCFFRLFEMVYARFAFIKANEAAVHEDVRRANLHKPADDLSMADKKPADYFNDVSPGANYYRQILGQCESVVKGELEMSHLEDTLRRFYIQKGYQLYTLEKMLNTCARNAMQILVSDNKDKSLEIIHLFYKDRKEDETTHDAELLYRKQVDKLSKDGDIYRITYVSSLSFSFPIASLPTLTRPTSEPHNPHSLRSDLHKRHPDLRNRHHGRRRPLPLLRFRLHHAHRDRRRALRPHALPLSPPQHAPHARLPRGVQPCLPPAIQQGRPPPPVQLQDVQDRIPGRYRGVVRPLQAVEGRGHDCDERDQGGQESRLGEEVRWDGGERGGWVVGSGGGGGAGCFRRRALRFR